MHIDLCGGGSGSSRDLMQVEAITKGVKDYSTGKDHR